MSIIKNIHGLRPVTHCCRLLFSRDKGSIPLELVDPTVELRQYLEVPLFRENEILFNPTYEEIAESQKLYENAGRHEIKFVTSAVDMKKCLPENLPEVIFIGQSNVGKSSLIKAIFHKTPKLIVKTSKTPGHTRTLNFYNVGKKLTIVDAPGYGYRQPEHFIQSVEGYLRQRRTLQRTFLLIDCCLGLTNWDMVAVDMLEEFKIPYVLVMTKVDKVATSRRLMNLLKMKEMMNEHASTCCFPQPYLVSSITREGLGFLQAFIAYVTGNMPNFMGQC